MKRNVGVGLIVLGYAALLHSMGGALHGPNVGAWPAALGAAGALQKAGGQAVAGFGRS